MRKIICLCGSTRFKCAFEEFATIFTLEGHTVLSVPIYTGTYGNTWTDEEKKALEEAHYRKIDMADEIFVLDVNCYIGESLAKELLYAAQHDIKIRYLSSEYPGWSERDCKYAPTAHQCDETQDLDNKAQVITDLIIRIITKMNEKISNNTNSPISYNPDEVAAQFSKKLDAVARVSDRAEFERELGILLDKHGISKYRRNLAKVICDFIPTLTNTTHNPNIWWS